MLQKSNRHVQASNTSRWNMCLHDRHESENKLFRILNQYILWLTKFLISLKKNFDESDFFFSLSGTIERKERNNVDVHKSASLQLNLDTKIL